jgi:hypothetical protein
VLAGDQMNERAGGIIRVDLIDQTTFRCAFVDFEAACAFELVLQ